MTQTQTSTTDKIGCLSHRANSRYFIMFEDFLDVASVSEHQYKLAAFWRVLETKTNDRMVYNENLIEQAKKDGKPIPETTLWIEISYEDCAVRALGVYKNSSFQVAAAESERLGFSTSRVLQRHRRPNDPTSPMEDYKEYLFHTEAMQKALTTGEYPTPIEINRGLLKSIAIRKEKKKAKTAIDFNSSGVENNTTAIEINNNKYITKYLNNNRDTVNIDNGDDANAHHATPSAHIDASPSGSYSQQHATRNALLENGEGHDTTHPTSHQPADPGRAPRDVVHADQSDAQPAPTDQAPRSPLRTAEDAERRSVARRTEASVNDNNTHSHSQEEPNGYTMGDAAHRSAHGRGTAGLHRSDRDVAGEHPQTNSRSATSSVRPASQSDTAPRGSGHEGDASVQGVSRDALTLSPGQAQPTTGRGAADMVGQAQETGVGLSDAPVVPHQGDVQSTPSSSVENSKPTGKGNKPARTPKKAKDSLEPIAPPARPDADAPFDVAKILAWGDYARSYALPESSRSNSKSFMARTAARCIAGMNFSEDFFLCLYFNWMKGIRVDLTELPDDALKSDTWPGYTVDLWVFAEHAREEAKKYREAKAKKETPAPVQNRYKPLPMPAELPPVVVTTTPAHVSQRVLDMIGR